MSDTADRSHVFTLELARKYPTLMRGEGVCVYGDEGNRHLDAIASAA